MIGRTIAHYQVLEKLGEGGMGVVWKARDTHLDRLVALKVLPADKVADPERKRRFVREAKAASALNHPNIVTIHDISQEDGTDFMVMEYVPGKALDQAIPRRGLRTGEALKYAIQIADALAKAHAAGIVHRDLKPGNLMVSDEGIVKVLDFGLAKLTEAAGTGVDEATRTIHAATEENTIVGTVSYMSPEQAEAKKVDARSDIFAFGAVLYEMVTGRRAFQGDSRMSTLAAILDKEPKAASEIAESVPRDLEKIITRCLRKEPGRRFQHMDDVKVALEEVKEETESGKLSLPVVQGRSRGKPWMAALTLGFAIGAAGAWWALRSERPTAAYGPVRPLTTYSGLEYEPALSPDGNQVAFAWNGESKDNFDIYVRLVDGGAALRLTTDRAPDRAPAWSPDGRRLAFRRNNAIYLIPALGGVERKLAQIAHGKPDLGPLSWSPDGRFLAASGTQDDSAWSIWIISTESGEAHRASTPPKGYSYDNCPSFSPDGHTLAFIRARDLYSRAIVLQEMNPDGTTRGGSREATGYERMIEDLAWQPDGRGLILTVRQGGERTGLFRWNLDGGFQPLGIDSDSVRWPSLSRTGHRLAYEKRRQDTNIYRIDGPGPNGGPRTYEQCRAAAVVDSTAQDIEPALSPDGRRLAFNSDRSGFWEIHVANADGSNQVALTAMGPTAMGSPRWSPDGQTIVLDRYENGRSMIYAVSAEGGKPRRLMENAFSYIRPSFSRDGKWIYFSSNRTGRNEIWKIPSGGGPAQQITHNSGLQPFESPDATRLYYANDQGLWSMPVAGGDAKLILPGVLMQLYALAGRSIYFGVPNPPGLWVLRTDTGRKFEYVRFPKEMILPPFATVISVSADERTILYTRVDRQESDLMLVENFK